MNPIWVFSGAKTNFPLYPVDVGAYEWAIENGLFQPRKPHESEPEFIGGFSDAGMEHYHYENGERQSGW